MNTKKLILFASFLGFLLIISSFTFAQRYKSKDSTTSLSMMHVHYSFLVPAGDLSTRFGNTINLGTGFLHKTKKNYIWGAEINYLSGSDVREKYIFDSLKTVKGKFITNEGRNADVRFFERGFSAYAHAGKIFPVFGSNKNSGIMLMAGVGFLQHKIHIEVLEENVPSLSSNYRVGYDRLSNGISLHEFIGYFYVSQKMRVNFMAGFDLSQSFTKNRRDWDFFAQRKLDESRKDYLNGFKIGFILPLYQRQPKEFYYR